MDDDDYSHDLGSNKIRDLFDSEKLEFLRQSELRRKQRLLHLAKLMQEQKRLEKLRDENNRRQEFISNGYDSDNESYYSINEDYYDSEYESEEEEIIEPTRRELMKVGEEVKRKGRPSFERGRAYTIKDLPKTDPMTEYLDAITAKKEKTPKELFPGIGRTTMDGAKASATLLMFGEYVSIITTKMYEVMENPAFETAVLLVLICIIAVVGLVSYFSSKPTNTIEKPPVIAFREGKQIDIHLLTN